MKINDKMAMFILLVLLLNFNVYSSDQIDAEMKAGPNQELQKKAKAHLLFRQGQRGVNSKKNLENAYLLFQELGEENSSLQAFELLIKFIQDEFHAEAEKLMAEGNALGARLDLEEAKKSYEDGLNLASSSSQRKAFRIKIAEIDAINAAVAELSTQALACDFPPAIKNSILKFREDCQRLVWEAKAP